MELTRTQPPARDPTRAASATVHVWPEGAVERDGAIEVAAQLERRTGERDPIWFRVPPHDGDALTEAADPFLLAALFPAMRVGERLHVHGPASSTLLRNLEAFQGAWAKWLPDRYRVVELVADEEIGGPADVADGRTVIGFSGGLDSCFSAWRHTRGDAGRERRRIVGGVMVHGFDIPLDQPAAFATAADGSRRILDSVGVPLIEMTTNVRELGDRLRAWWVDAHGAALAACLHLVARKAGAGLIASSHSFDVMRFPWGSNPLTDPMLSSTSLEIVNDGGAYKRSEKARLISGWPDAVGNLRVCWQGEHKDRNCGRCPRCVYTGLCFAVERVPVPEALRIESLERAVDGIANDPPASPTAEKSLHNIHDKAVADGLAEPWVGALGRLLRKRRRRARLPAWWCQRADRARLRARSR